MTMRQILAPLAVIIAATPAFAQDEAAIDCTLPENEALDACLGIPDVPDDATAFLPGVAPILGLAAAALLGGGGGGNGTPTTPTTPTTPSTN